MTFNNKKKDFDKTREFHETTSSSVALWINDDTGQLVDTLPIDSRIRPEPQPVPPSCEIAGSQQRHVEERRRFVDLIGHHSDTQRLLPGRGSNDPMLSLPPLALSFGSHKEVESHDHQGPPNVP